MPAKLMNPTKVQIKGARFSYLQVFQPKLNDLNGKMEYGTQVLIPKSDKEAVKIITEAEDNAIKKKWGKKPANPKFKRLLRDGDTETKTDGSPLGPEYKGHWFFSIRTDQKPGVVDAKLEPITEPSEFVSGDYGNVTMSFYGYEQKGNVGVSAGLHNIMRTKKGEPLGSRVAAEDDFDEEELDEEEAVDGDDF